MSEIAEPATATPARPGDNARKPRAPLWLAVLLIDAAVFLLGVLPAVFLGFGIQAIGARNEWWVGDPNSNDGEETYATFLGLVGALPLLTCMVVAVAVAARRRSRPAAPLTVVNTLAFVAVYTSLGIWWFQPAPLPQ
jgi:ABC-type Fe3+ transport system permease subunit